MRRVLVALAALAALLMPLGARAAVTYASAGAAAVTPATTGTCTPATTNLGTVGANDIVLLVVETENQAISLQTANGFTEVTNSPQSAGTAATSPASRLAVFWRRGFTSAPVVAASSDHTTCALFRFSGAKSTGNPWNITAGGNDSAANDTTAVIPGATTTVPGTLVVAITSLSNNATATTNCGTATNASLTGLTERFDSSDTAGLGGGFCLWTGDYAGPGTYNSTTSTLSVTSYKGALSLALEPEPVCAGTVCAAPGYPIEKEITAAAQTDSISVTTLGASLLVFQFSGMGANSGTLPATVSGGGLTWTRVTGASSNFGSGSAGTETWYAVSSGALSAQSITIDYGGTNTIYSGHVVLWSFPGRDASHVGAATTVASQATMSMTLNAQATDSFVVVQAATMSSSTIPTPVAFNSPWLQSYTSGGNADAAGAGYGRTTASGNVTVGSATATTQGLGGALEVLLGAAGGDGTATVTGTSGTGAVGAVSSTGTGSSTVAGVAGTGTVGTVTSSGSSSQDGTATVAGVSGSGATGATTSSGTASRTVVAASGSGSVGTVTSSGAAARTLVAAAGSGAVGAVTSSGTSASSPSGVAGVGAVGAVSAAGGATASLSQVSGTGEVGSVTSVGGNGGNGTATLTAVYGYGSAGRVRGGDLLQALEAVEAAYRRLVRQCGRFIP